MIYSCLNVKATSYAISSVKSSIEENVMVFITIANTKYSIANPQNNIHHYRTS